MTVLLGITIPIENVTSFEEKQFYEWVTKF